MRKEISFQEREMLLRGKCGEKRLLLRRICADEADNVMKLQRLVKEKLPDPDLMIGNEREEILESVEKDLAVGVFDGAALVGFCLLVANRDTPRNLGQKLGYPPEKCASNEIAFVHPKYRGLGLQACMIDLRIRAAVEMGAEYVFSTVKPENSHSLKNVTGGGFEIIDRREMYGGHDRFVLRKKL